MEELRWEGGGILLKKSGGLFFGEGIGRRGERGGGDEKDGGDVEEGEEGRVGMRVV